MKASLFAAMISAALVCLPAYSTNNPPTKPPAKTTRKAVTQIDLNKAEADILNRSVKGIGEKRAKAIVKYRIEHGNFNSIEELAKVPGFGTRFVKSHLKELRKVFIVG